MTSISIRSIFVTIIVTTLLSQTISAQFYQEWSYDLAQHVRKTPLSDKNGNFYFISWDWVSPYNTLNKVDSDGTTGWGIGFADRGVGNTVILLDQGGNIIIPVDSTPFASSGGYVHFLAYLKYSPSGTLIANPAVLEPLPAYFNAQNYSAGIDFADNVLLTGVEPEWITITYEGNDYLAAFGHLRLTFMNDAGVISKIVLDQGAEWTLDGFVGTIIGPDLNNEFLVQYTNKSGDYPSISYMHYLLRCSASSGVIWKHETVGPSHPVLGLSGSVYRLTSIGFSNAGFSKYDRMDNLEWTYNNPSDYYTAEIFENPIDSSVVDLLAPIGGGGLSSLICLEQDGSIRWRNSIGNFLEFDRDGNLLVKSSNSDLLQISRIDGSVISTTPNILIFGQLRADTLGNIFIVSRSKIVKLAPLPTLTVLDANKDALADKEMYLIRVVDDAPLFTEDTLGIVTTDADGKIQLTPVP